MKELLIGFIALGFIGTGCAQKEEVTTDAAPPVVSTEEKGSCEKCDKADCKCDHHKGEAKCAECQKGGKECDSCKKKHAGCKECASHHKDEHKKSDKKKKAKH